MPCHVLDGQESTIGQKNEVQQSVCDDSSLGSLDHTRENVKSRVSALICVLRETVARIEDIVGRALFPMDIWRVDSFLDLRAVKVNLAAGW